MRGNTNKIGEKIIFRHKRNKGNQGRFRGMTLEGSKKPSFQGKFLKKKKVLWFPVCVGFAF